MYNSYKTKKFIVMICMLLVFILTAFSIFTNVSKANAEEIPVISLHIDVNVPMYDPYITTTQGLNNLVVQVDYQCYYPADDYAVFSVALSTLTHNLTINETNGYVYIDFPNGIDIPVTQAEADHLNGVPISSMYFAFNDLNTTQGHGYLNGTNSLYKEAITNGYHNYLYSYSLGDIAAEVVYLTAPTNLYYYASIDLSDMLFYTNDNTDLADNSANTFFNKSIRLRINFTDGTQTFIDGFTPTKYWEYQQWDSIFWFKWYRVQFDVVDFRITKYNYDMLQSDKIIESLYCGNTLDSMFDVVPPNKERAFLKVITVTVSETQRDVTIENAAEYAGTDPFIISTIGGIGEDIIHFLGIDTAIANIKTVLFYGVIIILFVVGFYFIFIKKGKGK